MRIGNWDIANAKAKQWRYTPGCVSYKNPSEWTNGNLFPTMLNGYIGFKEINVVILVRGDDREDIHRNISILVSRCLGAQEYRLDGFDHILYGVLKSEPKIEEKSLNRWADVTLTLVACEYGEMITEEFTGKSILVQNLGVLPCLCKMEIKPTQSGTLLIDGLCYGDNNAAQTAKISNAVSGKTYVLDGENGLFTEDGKNNMENMEIWSLPRLLTGENMITSSLPGTIKVSYRPMYA